MSSARDQVNRLLALVPYLQSHEEVRLDDAAAAFGVTPAQIVRDLQVLWFCGLPGLGPGDMIDVDMDAFEDEGDGVIRLSNADYLSRPLRLGSTEASALIVALRAMREGSPESSRDAIDRALAKLEDATADGAPEASASAVVEVPPHVLATAPTAAMLEEAVRGGHAVRLTYFVPSRDETTERVVDPLAVLVAEGHTYLDAWCHLAEARRLFRLDRVSAAEVLEEPAARHHVPSRDLSDGLFEPGPDDVVATVRLAAPARWVAEYYPVESSRELADHGLEVTLRVGDPQWLVRLVLRLAPHAAVVSPSELAERVAAAAGATLERYRS
ncbi:WYL domain-containing protein [Nocardioides mangrovicus]|uniref:WYL domain-containing protein n=1 Tax=Nocardioides mangrovicus TaxID=2478913 RepID=A0A3L8NZT9_9ACTN|nr:WYL domain-containing protein [Nocardioides mangrovicus]RLV48696.1 WYL domain-containing protein [Nocardioides mangrovicus]